LKLPRFVRGFPHLEAAVRFGFYWRDPLLVAINQKVEILMANDAELLATLTAANQALQGIGAGVDVILPEVGKIGTETAGLQKQVADLTAALANQGNTSPEVDAQLTALRDGLASIASKTQNLGVQVKAVDDLVPDTTP
jgi:hypothetical protein